MMWTLPYTVTATVPVSTHIQVLLVFTRVFFWVFCVVLCTWESQLQSGAQDLIVIATEVDEAKGGLMGCGCTLVGRVVGMVV